MGQTVADHGFVSKHNNFMCCDEIGYAVFMAEACAGPSDRNKSRDG